MEHMNVETNETPSATNAVFPIRTVSEITGVNSITLRAWETRYGLIEPERTESGHRIYTQSNIDRIHRIVGMLDRGIRIGQVNEQLSNEDLPSGSTEFDTIDIWQRQVEHMLAAVIRFDEDTLDQCYSEMLALHEVNTVTDRLLVPLIRKLGTRWAVGKGSVAEEHFFVFFLRSKLGARLHHRNRNLTGPRLVLTCMPGDFHEIGLLLLAIEANNRGFQLVMLGANMPLEEIPAVVRKATCDAVLLSATVATDKRVFSNSLADLVAESAVPVFVGGAGAAAAANEIGRAGAVNCGLNIAAGLKQVEQKLGFDPNSGRPVWAGRGGQ
jgi:DNA-binding transcriptional MerR regulator/methylmalonyl-CoA mutase cobalamin-binding subunit